MKTAHLVLGTQLFKHHPATTAQAGDIVVMIEAYDICTKLPYHKHKLVLILAAMRHYRDCLESLGIRVDYVYLDSTKTFAGELTRIIREQSITRLSWMETADIGPGQTLHTICKDLGIEPHVTPSLQFITTPEDFSAWLSGQKQPLMESFYRWQRRRTGILMEGQLPESGTWNYDSLNRQSLPKDMPVPAITRVQHDKTTTDVMSLVDKVFEANPGKATNFWLPTTFDQSEQWLHDFVEHRLEDFGPYEDASRHDSPFLFHSVLSPLLNCGLLTPNQVIQAVLDAYHTGSVPIQSAEGFVRQVIGWREYMFGLYRTTPSLPQANYFGLTKELEDWWYTIDYQSQDLPIPVSAVLDTVHTYGYSHHIERLMVLGNWFLLNEYNPQSVCKWFSSMYVDAYEWVMVPNVQGMSQYADGGKVATKPYISGGNYLQKMGSWWPSMTAAKDSGYNTLYWQFLTRHHDKLRGNFRMRIALQQAQKRRDTLSE